MFSNNFWHDISLRPFIYVLFFIIYVSAGIIKIYFSFQVSPWWQQIPTHCFSAPSQRMWQPWRARTPLLYVALPRNKMSHFIGPKTVAELRMTLAVTWLAVTCISAESAPCSIWGSSSALLRMPLLVGRLLAEELRSIYCVSNKNFHSQ